MATRQAAQLRAAEDALVAERNELKRAQAVVDEVDVELRGRAAHIDKLRQDLNSVRTNKEYAAVLSQLNTEKADLSRVEARAYELMAAVEARKKAVAEREQALQTETARLQNARAQLEVTQKSFSDRLAALDKQRAQAAGQVDREALDLFNRVSERYEGEVMARVVRVNPRRDEFLCEGCNMALAAERANALLTRDELHTCSNCGRLLYIERGT
jgi:hypothetical protein